MDLHALEPVLTGLPPIDPLNIRPLMMLDVVHQVMLQRDWPYRAVSVILESHAGPTERFKLYGANAIHAIDEVHESTLDISFLNPAAVLNMARLGAGIFTGPRDVATIAVLPHHDQLAFAVSSRLGFGNLADLADLAASQYPLKVSVRGSLDAVTPLSVDVVLRSYGFSLADITAWGGEVSYDQPMPPHPTRLGRLKTGDIDAIFEEGAAGWIDGAIDAGATLLPIDDEHLSALEAQGFRRGVVGKAVCPSLTADLHTVDYSGWPLFCRSDTADELIEHFCRGLESGKERIAWGIGPVDQDPCPCGRWSTTPRPPRSTFRCTHAHERSGKSGPTLPEPTSLSSA